MSRPDTMNIIALGLLVSCLAGCMTDSPKVAPKITTPPSDQIVLPGDTAMFTVAASGSATLTYQWLMGNAKISGATSDTLKIPSSSHDSSFSCVVGNSAGMDTSVPVTLDLAWPPASPLAVDAQNNPVLDLDALEVMTAFEANSYQGSIDLLFAYSGGALKLMSPVAAQAAGDVPAAQNYHSASIQDIKFVQVAAMPATQEAGKAAYDAGPQMDASAVASGNMFIVKTTGGKYVYLQVGSIQGSGSTATATLQVSLSTF